MDLMDGVHCYNKTKCNYFVSSPSCVDKNGGEFLASNSIFSCIGLAMQKFARTPSCYNQDAPLSTSQDCTILCIFYPHDF